MIDLRLESKNDVGVTCIREGITYLIPWEYVFKINWYQVFVEVEDLSEYVLTLNLE